MSCIRPILMVLIETVRHTRVGATSTSPVLKPSENSAERTRVAQVGFLYLHHVLRPVREESPACCSLFRPVSTPRVCGLRCVQFWLGLGDVSHFFKETSPRTGCYIDVCILSRLRTQGRKTLVKSPAPARQIVWDSLRPNCCSASTSVAYSPSTAGGGRKLFLTSFGWQHLEFALVLTSAWETALGRRRSSRTGLESTLHPACRTRFTSHSSLIFSHPFRLADRPRVAFPKVCIKPCL